MSPVVSVLLPCLLMEPLPISTSRCAVLYSLPPYRLCIFHICPSICLSASPHLKSPTSLTFELNSMSATPEECLDLQHLSNFKSWLTVERRVFPYLFRLCSLHLLDRAASLPVRWILKRLMAVKGPFEAFSVVRRSLGVIPLLSDELTEVILVVEIESLLVTAVN